jgi:hypothetical protein
VTATARATRAGQWSAQPVKPRPCLKRPCSGNELSGNEPCPGRIACHSLLPQARPTSALLPALKSTPLRGAGRFRSGDLLLAFLSFTTRTPQRACISLLHLLLSQFYTLLNLTHYNILFRPNPILPPAEPHLEKRSKIRHHLDETRRLPIRTTCPLSKTHSSQLVPRLCLSQTSQLPCASATTWRARLPLSPNRSLCARTSRPLKATTT